MGADHPDGVRQRWAASIPLRWARGQGEESGVGKLDEQGGEAEAAAAALGQPGQGRDERCCEVCTGQSSVGKGSRPAGRRPGVWQPVTGPGSGIRPTLSLACLRLGVDPGRAEVAAGFGCVRVGGEAGLGDNPAGHLSASAAPLRSSCPPDVLQGAGPRCKGRTPATAAEELRSSEESWGPWRNVPVGRGSTGEIEVARKH